MRRFTPPPESQKIHFDSDTSAMRQKNQAALAVNLSKSTEDGHVYIETPAGRRLRPNIRATIEKNDLSGEKVLIRTNSLGFRGPEIGPKSPNHTRVLFLGDSITFADYLVEEESFVSLVQAFSEKSKPNHSLETINTGVGSTCVIDYLSILRDTGLGVQPDVVVLEFYLNDFLPSPAIRQLRVPESLKEYRMAHLLMKALSSIEFKGAERALFRLKKMDLKNWQDDVARDFPPSASGANADFRSKALENIRDWGAAWSKSAWEQITPTYLEFGKIAKAQGFKLLVAMYPATPQVEAVTLEDYPQSRMKAIAAEMGAPVLDLLPRMREEHSKNPSVKLYFDQCHPTTIGNRIYAEELHAFIQRNL